MDLGPMELGLLLLGFLVLFGHNKLPDASRALGRALRIFKGEMRGLQDDGRAPAPELDLESQARAAEAAAARARTRADAARAASSDARP